jgi:hypothetical protein
MKPRISVAAMAAVLAAALSNAASAQTIFTEDFTGAKTNNSW